MDQRSTLYHEPRWLPARQFLRSAVTRDLWDWLLDPGSLTRRLQRSCGPRFHVHVLAQGWGRPLASERRALGMKRGGRVLIREVQLMCDDTPWVFARTVIPVRTLRGRQRRLARLGSRPLGAALFADPQLKRGEAEIAHLGPGDGVYEKVAVNGAADGVWGRRSVFTLRGKPLLVSEFFLPALLHGHGLE